MKSLYGIECKLTKSDALAAFESVLNRIRDVAADDLRALQQRVRLVEPYSDCEENELGIVLPYSPTYEEFRENPDSDLQVRVHIAEDNSPFVLATTIAHEFGHALTTGDQLEWARREITDHLGWAKEAVADLYVLKWLDVDIDLLQSHRDTKHHKVPFAELKNHVDIVRGPREDDESYEL